MTGAAMSGVLEKTMSLDESLTKAFSTISEFASFDSHSLVPHPENLKFQTTEERRAMCRLGIYLAETVGNPDSEDLQYAAHVIKRHFCNELGLSQPPELATQVPRFLLEPDHKMEPRTDPQELASQLAAVPVPETSVLCIVSSKLALLQKRLNLPDVAIKFLTLAYANNCRHSLTKDDSSGLSLALSYIGIEGDDHRNRAVAVLLDVPLAEVEAMFMPPITMTALRFVDVHVFNQARCLRSVFTLSDEFVTLLETPHLSHAAVLARILEPEHDLDTVDDGSTPIGYLYEIMPSQIAECYERTVLNRPLLYQHVHHLVEWFTGGLSLPVEACYALDSRLTFESIRDAIKRAALACCTTNRPLEAHAILKALFAASGDVPLGSAIGSKA
jgi:hypothetical protein